MKKLSTNHFTNASESDNIQKELMDEMSRRVRNHFENYVCPQQAVGLFGHFFSSKCFFIFCRKSLAVVSTLHMAPNTSLGYHDHREVSAHEARRINE